MDCSSRPASEWPGPIRDEALPAAEAVREIYRRPEVTGQYDLVSTPPDREAIVRFLCDEHAFGRERVEAAIERAWGGENG